MLHSIRTHIIVVTGLRRAGLGLVADMLRAGNVPPARIAFAFDPHKLPSPIVTACVLGIFVDRSSTQLLASIERENAREGRAPLSPHERRILKRGLLRDLCSARDAAASLFPPVYVFAHSLILDDPHLEASRLKRILSDHYPLFSERAAALAVRRIYAPPRIFTGTFRVIEGRKS